MTPKQDTYRHAAGLGVTIELHHDDAWDSRALSEIELLAPNGSVFAASHTHCLITPVDRDLRRAWECVLGDLKSGLVRCEDARCDSCVAEAAP